MTAKFLLISIIALVAASDSHAQKPSRFRQGYEVRGKGEKVVREEGRTVIYKKHNIVDFDDSLIEGEVKNPSEFYFVHRPEKQFGSLVQKRKNFHKEMLRDAVMIR